MKSILLLSILSTTITIIGAPKPYCEGAGNFGPPQQGSGGGGGGNIHLPEITSESHEHSLPLRDGTRSFKVGNIHFENGYIIFGQYYMWISSDGLLRTKNGVPQNDTDGTPVASQTN